jgi:hypothetical protein
MRVPDVVWRGLFWLVLLILSAPIGYLQFAILSGRGL